jgi:class 3 adenylate cyclase
MFRIFDEIVANYKTVTKIKCIGDCYRSAAGSFGVTFNPMIQAIEMIMCSLDLIDAISVVNKDMGTKLSVRIGVAFGGPISAGVMGIHKPVFDIWGAVVNQANAMEASGAPMKVHVTNNLYEMLRFERFVFEEGENGTYFVTRVKSRASIS